jgi:hypothetical protein
VGPFVVLVLCIAGYMLPTIIAFQTKNRKVGNILLMNLFLGWTGLFYVIALIMAMDKTAQARTDPRN